MKHNQLYNELTKAGCFITRHGAEHDEWFNPKNGMKIRIPRHGSHEVKTGLLRRIKKDVARTIVRATALNLAIERVVVIDVWRTLFVRILNK